MPSRKPKTKFDAKFRVGDKVRIRHGVMDNNYPDLPIGGWSGTVVEVHKGDTYTVRWSKETLASIHPVFKKRCERDVLDLETYWIGADDLEPDTGGPLEIEQPKRIITKPLSSQERDDRIRMALGLTSDDPLPGVDDETLRVYHENLSKNLGFPFRAEHDEGDGHPERVKVIGLGDSDDEPMIDETYGIFCEARFEGQIVTLPLAQLDEATRNRKLINDYRYWFWNCR